MRPTGEDHWQPRWVPFLSNGGGDYLCIATETFRDFPVGSIRWYKNQGILIPENLKKLAGNKLVFPNLTFNPDEDIPASYRMVEKRTDLVEMKLNQ